MRAFAYGALIRSRNGLFLAIPTEAAGRLGDGRKRITPGGWERRTGLRLRFVYRRGAPSLLVADNARLTSRGRAARNEGRRGDASFTPARRADHRADLHPGAAGHAEEAAGCRGRGTQMARQLPALIARLAAGQRRRVEWAGRVGPEP